MFIVQKDGFITTFSLEHESFLHCRSLSVCVLLPSRENAVVLKSSHDWFHVPGSPCHHTLLAVTVGAMYLESHLQILSTTVIAVILSTKYV